MASADAPEPVLDSVEEQTNTPSESVTDSVQSKLIHSDKLNRRKLTMGNMSINRLFHFLK